MAAPRKLIPYLMLGITIVVLGFSAIWVRLAGVDGPVMAFYRMAIASLALTPLWLLRHRRPATRLPAQALVFPLAAGVFTALDHTLFNTAIRYTSVNNTTLLNYTAPIWVALFAWLALRERLTGLFWLGLALTMSGAAVVLGSDYVLHPTLSAGDGIALFSSFFYAGYFIITQRGRQRIDTLTYVWLVTVVAALVLLGLCLALRLPLAGFSLPTYLAFLGAGLVSQVIGYLTLGYALGHLPASVVSPTMIGQPVMTALLAWLVLGEGLQPAQVLGGAVVLVGLYLVYRARGEDGPANEPESLPERVL